MLGLIFEGIFGFIAILIQYFIDVIFAIFPSWLVYGSIIAYIIYKIVKKIKKKDKI